jgi:hypothetical protein
MLVRRLKEAMPVEQPPQHQWIASIENSARCTCGWDFDTSDVEEAQSKWSEHAGNDCLMMPWYAE